MYIQIEQEKNILTRMTKAAGPANAQITPLIEFNQQLMERNGNTSNYCQYPDHPLRMVSVPLKRLFLPPAVLAKTFLGRWVPPGDICFCS